MNSNKYKLIACIADSSSKAQRAYQMLKEQYQFIDLENDTIMPDVVVVLGGDGFMLHSLHSFMHLNIPLYGMNAGTVGFLMNSFSENNLLERLNSSKCTNVHPLKMTAITEEGKIYTALAINEVHLFRETNQTAKIQITVDNHTRMEEMIGDGVLVATSAGSSAYNFSAGGAIIPLGAGILALTPISPFRPRRWRGALLPHTVTINFEVKEPAKRPVSASADFIEVRNVVSVEVKEVPNKKLRILFDPDHSLEERIISEQFA
jgi:NAD+ kinase